MERVAAAVRHTDMQAQLPVPREARLRAVAVLLICTLALALGSAARAQHADAHVARHNAVLSAAPVDSPSTLHRVAPHGDLAARPAAVAVLIRTLATSDSSPTANSRTAHTTPGRGPPVQALA